MINFIRFWKRQPTVLIFIHLIQDLDLVLPLLVGLQDRHDLIPQVCVIDKILEESPRVKSALQTLGIKYSKVSRLGVLTGIEPNLLGIRALVTASESTAGPHKAAYTLTIRANKSNIYTYTLQHGFENIGLNYSDEVYSLESVRFASQKILIWANTHLLPIHLSSDTHLRCVPVGCPKEVSPLTTEIEIPGRRKYLVAVFENLHWNRYHEDYRQHFLNDLEQTAVQFPNTTFLVKPHHAGKWLTSRYRGSLPCADNLVIADPENPLWEPFTAPAIIKNADGVITTPSTVAVDAARAGCPVSVVGYGLDLTNYTPLPIINSLEDWTSFIQKLQHSEGKIIAKNKTNEFIDKNLIAGDAIKRILDLISADISSSKNVKN
ncbi:hypothetical protein [Calothrix sp. PCC 7507]|uniref:hypothetical protein n=1 Tax=Calothrix sp. PCC 7507 TaxID=99598 RepID=UPI00029EDB91|nr:hypothetical protein [Calothrix sp. PCC 7507]AFY35622.1 hypothetical protein Cal7507_5283 [Calothrix sp. PCC 7507]